MTETIVVAVIAATPATLAALAGWRSTAKTRFEVGKTNGDGTLAVMMSKVIATQGRMEATLERHIEDDGEALSALHAAIEQRN